MNSCAKMGWQYIFKARKFIFYASRQKHQALDLLPRKKCIIKEKTTLFEPLNGLISFKHHDITVFFKRPNYLIKNDQILTILIFGAKILILY